MKTMPTRASTGQIAMLNHLRWIAAFLVVVQHARGFVMIEYYPNASLSTKAFYFVTGFSHSAVMVFFVLSGYLVGGKALGLMTRGAEIARRDRFFVDRVARIAIVLWPAILLAAIVASLAPRMPVLTVPNWAGPNPSFAQFAGLKEWIGTSLLLNETVTDTVSFNSPLWSLAFEWNYYIIATGMIFLIARDRRPGAIALIAYMLGVLTLCIVLRPLILILFASWLMGAAATRARRGVPAWLSIPLLLLMLVCARLGSRTTAMDLAVSAATAMLLTSGRVREAAILPAIGAWLADFSFSLYAVHIPVMLGLMSMWQVNGVLLSRQRAGLEAFVCVALLVGASYLVAYTFSLATEKNTNALRNLLLRKWTG